MIPLMLVIGLFAFATGTPLPGYADFHGLSLEPVPLLKSPILSPAILPAPIIKTPIFEPAPILAPAPVIKTVAPVVKAIAPATSYATVTQYHVAHTPIIKTIVAAPPILKSYVAAPYHGYH